MKFDNISVKKSFYIVFLLNFILSCFIAKKYFHFLEEINGLFLMLYYITITFSHFFILNSIPLLITLLALLFTHKKNVLLFLNIQISSNFLLILIKSLYFP